jgi:hypothetical protein
MSAEFFKTRMGMQFYEASVPRIAEALEGIEKQMKEQNRLVRIQMGLEESEEKEE